MELQGRGNVAASNCSKVVNIVSRFLYGKDIPITELPCHQTVLNMCSESLFLSKTHAVDEIKNKEHFMYGTDEASKQKRKYIEMHIYLSDGGVVSCGFDEVACEDSDTLFEKSVTLLKDLSSETYIDSVHDGDNFSPEEYPQESGPHINPNLAKGVAQVLKIGLSEEN